MLDTLLIRDFVIVDHAEISLDTGFTVFSGETGAGKSILIDALSLALGARGDASVVRTGAARADICAVFVAPARVQAWLAEQGLEGSPADVTANTVSETANPADTTPPDHAAPESTLILRRVIDTQGRSRAYINGIPCPLTQLRELGEQLVDIHGQHAHQSLLRSAQQRDLLDAQGGAQQVAQARLVAQSWQDWQVAQQALQAAQQDQQTLQALRERLAQQLHDLDQLALKAGEWESLSAQQSQLAHAQALMQGGAGVLTALEGDGEDTATSVQRQLRNASHTLQALLRFDARLQGIFEALESACITVNEAASDLQSYLHQLELDPDALARVEARLSAVFDLARRYRVEPEDLLALHERTRTEFEASVAGADIAALQNRVAHCRAAYDAHAARLSTLRQHTAQRLGKQVTHAMQELAMQGGQFEVALTACNASSHGVEAVEFLVAGHAGTPTRPLGKVASGGELARLSLALSVIASQAARVPTLIFDEVDSGVGGAVAEVVGRLLRELGGTYQVLCVTHLPQVAACGNQHYRVEKTRVEKTQRPADPRTPAPKAKRTAKTAQTAHAAPTLQTVTVSRIQALDAAGRVEEIARMLGGITVSDVTRSHARELLGMD